MSNDPNQLGKGLVPRQPSSLAAAPASGLATRRFVPMGELAQLVAEEVSRLLAAGTDFSAYAVTLALRQSHPTLEIVHETKRPGDTTPTVREAVHTAMVSAMQPGRAGEGWQMEWRTTKGNPARWYFPPAQPVLPGAAAQPALPISADSSTPQIIDGETA